MFVGEEAWWKTFVGRILTVVAAATVVSFHVASSLSNEVLKAFPCCQHLPLRGGTAVIRRYERCRALCPRLCAAQTSAAGRASKDHSRSLVSDLMGLERDSTAMVQLSRRR